MGRVHNGNAGGGGRILTSTVNTILAYNCGIGLNRITGGIICSETLGL